MSRVTYFRPPLCPENFRRRRGERGVAVLILAVCLSVLFAFVALVLDGARVATSAQESQNFASFAALAALEEFATASLKDPESALEKALARANRVARMNVVFKESEANEIGRTNLLLEPGIWFPSLNMDGSNPCLAAGASAAEPPCFLPDSTVEKINSFRLRGKLYQSVLLRFAAVAFNSSRFAANVNAIAALVPRHGIFIVDLSRSMEKSTHDALLDGSGHPTGYLHRYAYAVDDPEHQEDWDALVAHYPTRGSVTSQPKSHFTDDYQTISPIKDDDFTRELAVHHAHPDDYHRRRGGDYRVDVYRERAGANAYRGPEPLTSMLRGLHRAVTRFKERKVSGDRIGIIFYDRTLEWPRILKLSSDFDYIQQFTDPEKPESVELRNRFGIFPMLYSNTNTPLALTEALNQFSSADAAQIPASRFVVLMGDGLTNCRSCGREWKRIDFDDSDEVDNHVDYPMFDTCQNPGSYHTRCFTDFESQVWSVKLLCMAIQYSGVRSACQQLDLDGDGVVGLNGQGGVDAGDQAVWERLAKEYSSCALGADSIVCNNSFSYYYSSMEKVKHLAKDRFGATRTAMHVLLVGEDVGPHTIDLEDPNHPGQCLSESRRRVLSLSQGELPGTIDLNDKLRRPNGQENLLGPTYTCHTTQLSCGCFGNLECSAEAEDHFRNANASDPFLPVNKDLYDVAQLTGGIFAPLRPPYTADAAASCTPDPCRPCTTCGQEQVLGATQLRLTDPQCRTLEEQMDAYVDEILGLNPYSLVAE